MRWSSFIRAAVAVPVAALVVSACASHDHNYNRAAVGAADAYTAYGTAEPAAPHAAQTAMAVPPKPEIEADGLPVQTAPFHAEVREPDDPSEPFSPNYGPRDPALGHTAKPARKRGERQARRTAATQAPRIVRSRRLSNREANAVIAAALAAHEVRYP
ncbi:MAG: hypothetical protein AAFR60_03170 [Pseudomonadota bacterium]